MLETNETLTEASAQQAPPGKKVDREFTVKERTQWQLAGRRFLKHRAAFISLIVFILLVLFAFVGQKLWHYKYEGDLLPTSEINAGPSSKHPFGTTDLYDEMALIMRGTQQSLKVAFIIAIVGTGLGALWGVVSGFFSGFIDSALMRFADLALTIPALALAAALARQGGGKLWLIGLILAAVSAPYVARVVRGVVLSLREREFIEAARALGASNTRIMLRHLLPNTIPVLIVNATLLIAAGILLETALSYVGFGIQSPDTSLGILIVKAQGSVQTKPWLFYFPGLFIILIALTVNFIGDGLRDALDPRQTRERK
ncbi:MAG: glutathione transport system permease protein [Pseudonocardiales bacterium]|jgi:peptide/nickel transport system permease protein|nr:glutathione transport system permease protein [Pseudonocardiales bacterium]MDT4921311.1 glutathione transport system permease protein [Pseudonocardiales bacterium]